MSLHTARTHPANTIHCLNVGSMLGPVADDGPTLIQHWVNLSCCLGWGPGEYTPLVCHDLMRTIGRSRGPDQLDAQDLISINCDI